MSLVTVVTGRSLAARARSQWTHAAGGIDVGAAGMSTLPASDLLLPSTSYSD